MVAGTHRKPSGELGEVSAGNHSIAQQIAGGSKVGPPYQRVPLGCQTGSMQNTCAIFQPKQIPCTKELKINGDQTAT